MKEKNGSQFSCSHCCIGDTANDDRSKIHMHDYSPRLVFVHLLYIAFKKYSSILVDFAIYSKYDVFISVDGIENGKLHYQTGRSPKSCQFFWQSIALILELVDKRR